MLVAAGLLVERLRELQKRDQEEAPKEESEAVKTTMKRSFKLLTAFLLAPLATLHAAAEPITNSIGMKLVHIQPGTFMMGQDGPQTDYQMKKHPGESGRPDWDEKPVHRVVISKPFHIGATEVTVAQYRQFDSAFRAGKGLPDEAASELRDDARDLTSILRRHNAVRGTIGIST